MASGGINWRILCLAASALAITVAPQGSAYGQRVLDFPVRSGGGSDALIRGPVAVFWNPGAVGIPAGRGEFVLLNVQGPSATSVDGVALASLVRLDERTTLGAGFRHIGLDEIPATSTSPLPDDVEGSLDIGESTFSIVAARTLGTDLVFGAGAHFTRAARDLNADDEVSVGAGFHRPGNDWTPGVGASARIGEEGTEWEAGLALAPSRATLGDGSFDVSYGISGSPRFEGLSHRAVVGASWSTRLRVSGGLAGEPGSDGHAWEPVLGVAVQLRRYSVGVLREALPNGVGAVHTFRLGVSF